MNTNDATPLGSLDELEALHIHKNEISGFRGERGCGRKPSVNAGKRVALKLRQKTDGSGQAAFYGQTQHSTAYSCPVGHRAAKRAKEADVRFLTDKHVASGGMVLSGSFGMVVKNSLAPKGFYDPKESFRKSDQWDMLVAKLKSERDTESDPEKRVKISIHEAMKTKFWQDFANENIMATSYGSWDLSRRLDAVDDGISYLFLARDFKRLQKRVGVDILGYVVATEIEVNPLVSRQTGVLHWGGSRNNVHIHFLLFLSQDTISAKSLRILFAELHKRWALAVKQHGFRSTLSGSHLKRVVSAPKDLRSVSRYLTKGVSPGQDASGLGGSFWDALRESYAGSWQASTWWQNFEGAVRNRRMFRISYSMMQTYKVKEERMRKLALWEASQQEPVDVAYFDRTAWYLATAATPELRKELRRIAERDGVDAARMWLEQKGIPFHLVEGQDTDGEVSATYLVREALRQVTAAA
jgi:hypothetical protein